MKDKEEEMKPICEKKKRGLAEEKDQRDGYHRNRVSSPLTYRTYRLRQWNGQKEGFVRKRKGGWRRGKIKEMVITGIESVLP